MADLMDVSQQELVGVEIRVDCNNLNFPVFAIAEVAQLGSPGFLNFKREWNLQPESQAVVHSSRGQVFFEDFSELIRMSHLPQK